VYNFSRDEYKYFKEKQNFPIKVKKQKGLYERKSKGIRYSLGLNTAYFYGLEKIETDDLNSRKESTGLGLGVYGTVGKYFTRTHFLGATAEVGVMTSQQYYNFGARYNFEYDLAASEKEFFSALEFIKEFDLQDTEYVVNASIKSGQKVLAEGAQGSLLDIDFGSYPFVTSSSTTAAGVCSGLGVAPNVIGEVFGIFKAYCTRVGSGPFPTELDNYLGEKIRQEGREFGATTGRARRTGWLDLPALKYSIMLNGVTQLIMMKVDVLNFLDEVNICTHYRLPDGTITEQMPFDLTDTHVEPIYKSFKGWACSLEGMRKFDQIPTELADYVNYLEAELQVPISFISTGPDREEIIVR
jgi:adenylosuccinate synthase